MKDKWLYTFRVNREVDYPVETTEISKRTGKEIKVTKQEKRSRPVLVRIKKPGRKLFDEGELYYGVKLSEGIKAGLLTRALLAKRYQNDGGAMSEPEKEKYSDLYLRLFEKENELQRYQVNLEKISEEEKKDRITDLLVDMSDLRRELQDFETSQSALFDQTAETRAKNKTIMWWILQLAQVEKLSEDIKDYHWYKKEEEAKDEDKEKVYKEELKKAEFANVFSQETLEEKMDHYDSLEEGGDEFWQEALRKMAYFISYWYSGQAESEDDFQRVEEFLQTEESAAEIVEEREAAEEDLEEELEVEDVEPEVKEEIKEVKVKAETPENKEVLVEPEKVKEETHKSPNKKDTSVEKAAEVS